MLTLVSEPSQVAQARRAATAFAAREGTSEVQVGAIAIVVTELATNLLKHGGGGEIVVGRFNDADGTGIEVLAMDRGCGMADVARCLQDGYSTAGSLGQGLGAASRQSDHLRIWSRPGQGTVVAARFVLQAWPMSHRLACSAAQAQYPGELACGDGWALADARVGSAVLLVDGSGHGIEAHKAAQAAVKAFQQNSDEPGEELVARLHRVLMPTRGAALAVARVDKVASLVRYTGVGNISGRILSGSRVLNMVSHNGTAGHVAPRIREFTYPYSGDPLLVLHSDGVTARWDLSTYPGLLSQHPSLLAGVLLRDFRRGRDDASVVAMRLLQ